MNKGLKEFEGRDRAFIIRFNEDNSYVTLDYRSSAILHQDLVERLGLAKGDQVKVRCPGGEFTGKVWFLGTNEEVRSKEKEAEQIMRRIDEGESLNISDISLTNYQSFHRFDQQVSQSPLPSTQVESGSDFETECHAPPKKRSKLQTSASVESQDNGENVTNAELVRYSSIKCDSKFFYEYSWSLFRRAFWIKSCDVFFVPKTKLNNPGALMTTVRVVGGKMSKTLKQS